jgi:hypothetical protein
VHLLTAGGELAAQSDSPPRLPTSLWLPSIPVSDEHLLALPEAYAGEEYQLRVGLYHWPDLVRVPAAAACLDTADDALLLGNLSFADRQSVDVQTCMEAP